MTKHSIVGVFGEEEYNANLVNKSHSAVLNYAKNDKHLNYGLADALMGLYKFNLQPSEIGIDLLVFASLVYAADTRISRASESQDNWTREIQLVVPVSNVERWQEAAPQLRTMLNFLTGDRWSFAFTLRPTQFLNLTKPTTPSLLGDKYNSLGLFSGGLDSLIDSINVLEEGKTPLFISHSAEGAVSSSQRNLLAQLRRHYGKQRIDALRLWMSFSNNLIPGVGAEETTRGRSFLFIALGALVGTAFRAPIKLRIPENGFIALNVPLDPMRLGALSTRTTHPFYLARWNDILATLGTDVQVENPYRHYTKGEMVKNCSNMSFLESVVNTSMSCSSPTKGRWMGKGQEHCGYCLPCLVRRAALLAGLQNEDTTSYSKDLLQKPLNALESEGKQVRSFQLAIERLRMNPGAARFLIYKPGPLSDVQGEIDDLKNVYVRGMSEIDKLLTNVKTISK